MLKRLLLAFAMILSVPTALSAQARDPLEGLWIFEVEGTGVFGFALEKDGESWKAQWLRPRRFASDGVRFIDLVGPPVPIEATATKETGGWLELTFADPRPHTLPDVFRIHVAGTDTAEAIYADTGFPVLPLVRGDPASTLGPWGPGQTYTRADADSLTPGALVQFSAAPPADDAPTAQEPVQGPAEEPAVEGR
ncbi:conserved hypothetical protein [Altererythrobacter sp. B11]|uniref:hypothetical protein n=1 Tax=Altererythrobacter sp. B11 TaxID=2060312 RepID=UPI000DC720A6|nr:hypothetical protein [Altererythrobacter sp. B11]BBC71858.1 conserved hypothetical protein [Altererythrobacter sp. B11]